MPLAQKRYARQANFVTPFGVGWQHAQCIVGPGINRHLVSGGIYRLVCGAGQRGKNPLSGRKAAMFWRMAGGITLGIGIWSMHFIGMLSMNMPMIMSYHLWLTLASLGVAVPRLHWPSTLPFAENRSHPYA